MQLAISILTDEALLQRNDGTLKTELNTLSFRLKYALEYLSVSQTELAKRIGVKPQIIQYICSKNLKSSKFTYEIAEALGVSNSWLATGELPMILNNDVKIHQIPLLTWEVLKNHLEINITNCSSYIFVNSSNNEGSFALHMNDNSLEPRIDNDTLLVFNQMLTPDNNDFVLVKLIKKNIFLIRQLHIINNIRYLLPVNTDMFKIIELSNNDQIVAVLIQTIQNFKKV